MGKFIDLTGKRFGRLIVISKDLNNKSKRIKWICKCDCGNTKSVYGFNLQKGYTKSCGCLQKENTSKASKHLFNQYEIIENILIIYNDQKTASCKISAHHLSEINDRYWYKTKQGYWQSGRGRDNFLHNVLIPHNKDEYIDHHDRNKDNCTDENLLVCTYQKNTFNRTKPKNNTSGIIGVSWNKEKNKWEARITYNEKRIFLGYFVGKDNAIKARLNAEKEYFKEFAPQRDLFERYGI